MDAKTAELFRTAGNGLIAFANKSEELDAALSELAAHKALLASVNEAYIAVVAERNAAIDEGIRVGKQLLRLRNRLRRE